MKSFKFTFLCFLVAMYFSCDKEQIIEPCNPIDLPEPYEEIYTSFNLPDLGIQIDDTTSICRTPNAFQELAFGGPSGFHYEIGFNEYNFSDLNLFQIVLHVRGLAQVSSSSIPFETILDICETYPEQCFVRILIRIDDKYYSNITYTSIPYEMSFNDPDAFYDYSFVAVSEEDSILECYENRQIMPVEFEYDGYLYTNDFSDSLRIENLMSDFVIFPYY